MLTVLTFVWNHSRSLFSFLRTHYVPRNDKSAKTSSDNIVPKRLQCRLQKHRQMKTIRATADDGNVVAWAQNWIVRDFCKNAPVCPRNEKNTQWWEIAPSPKKKLSGPYLNRPFIVIFLPNSANNNFFNLSCFVNLLMWTCKHMSTIIIVIVIATTNCRATRARL